jgi:tetratricopeptide (TPR) repeat protein
MMPQHTQFLLMNAHKSTDFYAQYSGVAMDRLLNKVMLPTATGIMVYAPDGWAQFHPLYPDPNPLLYQVFGDYAPAIFYYDQQADIVPNPTYGWCNYSAPSVAGRKHEDPIINPKGLKMLLAIKRDGEYLDPGKLTDQNKLDGEGPFRIVPPQKLPGPPDQSSKVKTGGPYIWPFNEAADHNAGYSTRSATIIKVEPLPKGTTDIDTMEAGWPYVDSAQIVIYGNINPVPNILEKLVQLHEAIDDAPKSAFKQPFANKLALKLKIDVVWWLVKIGHYDEALRKLDNDILQKMNGCIQPSGTPDKNDWVKNCEIQKQFYWLANEIMVLMKIVA